MVSLWRLTRHAVTDALLKTALSIARTKKEAARFLGVDYMGFNHYIKKYIYFILKKKEKRKYEL